MRALPAVAALGLAAASLSACVYVDRGRPVEPAAVRTAPSTTVVTPDPVTPYSRPPAAVIVR